MSPALYFGDPRGALALIDRGVVPCGVVHGRRGGPGWRRLVPLLRDVPRWTLPDLDDPAVLAELSALRPALLVAGFYPRRIPAAVLALAPGMNVHPSDLPRWRGPDPTHWTVRAGDETTALCVHQLSEGLDEGDVLVREPVAVGARETAVHLADRLEARGAELLAEVAARVLAGEALPATPQTGEPSWAPLPDPDSLEIDWSRGAAEIDRLVRASTPDPGAFTGIGDELLVVHAGRPVAAGRFESLPPGTPYVHAERTFIRCGAAPRGMNVHSAAAAYRLDRVVLGRTRMSGRTLARLLV